jgi:hypothetical protein
LAAEMADAELKASLTQAAVQWEQLATETGHRASEFSNPDLPWIPQFYLCRRRSAASSERACGYALFGTIHRNHIAQQELFISLTAFHPSIVCFLLKGKSRCAYH